MAHSLSNGSPVVNAFVRNLWYMAGWAQDVCEGQMLARTFLGRPWIVLRTHDGSYAMLADRCPHRFVALSKGTRNGDVITCAYHGLGFSAQGRCVHSPFGHETALAASVPTLPVVERWGILWFWPGDPAAADPALIPDFALLDDPKPIARATLRMDVGYELITDNLMDLSHAEFIHRATFGVNGSLMDSGQHRVVSDESGAIWNNWDMTDTQPPEWSRAMLPEGALIDQWLHIRWHAPASMALFIGLAQAGTDRREMVVPPMANPHILTPETPNSTWYFYTSDPGPEAEAFARKVFLEEDEPMVKSAAQGMAGEDFWALKPLILPTDAGAIRARRRLMQLRREEALA